MRVLLATDGSEQARAATAALADFPVAEPATVLVLAVALRAVRLELPSVTDAGRESQEAAERTTAEAQATLLTRWRDVEVRIVEGEATVEIPRVAREWGADLVVVGARGLGAVAGFFLGSVSTSVLHRVDCPVLVVKGPPGPVTGAVVAIDGSPDALAAARFLSSLPLPPALRVRLLAVVEPLRALPVSAPEIGAAPLGAFIDDVLREQQTHLEGILTRVEADVRGRVAHVESSVVFGPPAEEIAAAAREPGVNLVVMGARGLGAVRRLVLGSVSDAVVRNIDCAALIVKGAAPAAAPAV